MTATHKGIPYHPIYIDPYLRLEMAQAAIDEERCALNSIPELIDLLLDNKGRDWKKHGHVNIKHYDDLTLFNYRAKAQIEGNWTWFERVSRGLIINNQTGEVVARPFDKFFNWGEGGRTTDAPIRQIYEKLDGSLGIMYRYNDSLRISTRGSLASEQATWATNKLQEYPNLDKIPDEYTLLFEIIYPENRVVVDYGELEDLILLAIRNRHTGEMLPFYDTCIDIATMCNFGLADTYNPYLDIGEIIARLQELSANEEGYVIEFEDGQRFKFKGDEYKRLHKLISGLSPKYAYECVRDGIVDTVREVLPDEFVAEFNEWVEEVQVMSLSYQNRAELAYFEAPAVDDRKQFAMWVMANHKDIAPLLFALLDGKDIRALAMKLVGKNWEKL